MLKTGKYSGGGEAKEGRWGRGKRGEVGGVNREEVKVGRWRSE